MLHSTQDMIGDECFVEKQHDKIHNFYEYSRLLLWKTPDNFKYIGENGKRAQGKWQQKLEKIKYFEVEKSLMIYLINTYPHTHIHKHPYTHTQQETKSLNFQHDLVFPESSDLIFKLPLKQRHNSFKGFIFIPGKLFYS